MKRQYIDFVEADNLKKIKWDISLTKDNNSDIKDNNKNNDIMNNHNNNNNKQNDYKDYNKEVFMVDNNIYFRGQINNTNINILDGLIRKANTDFKELKAKNPKTKMKSKPLYLFIMSFGGSLFAGFRGVDIIKNSKIPIYTVIEGYAMSAGTLLSMAGKKKYAYENSFILIHQLFGVAMGTYEKLEDEHKNHTLMMNKIRRFYIKHSKGKLNEEELKEMLKHDLLLETDKCLEYGIIDKIYRK